jgi:Ribbon-helix-helix protein, copG family
MKTISLKLPVPLANWLAKRSKELGRSKSDIVRQALEEQRQKKGALTCHDLMKDLCGSFSGPPDLSTNPKYLDEFGK